MYVLKVSRGYPTNKYKTNGIFEFDQAKALVNEGCKVVYAAVDIRSVRRWRKWGIEKKIIDGVHIYAINIPVGRIPRSIQDRISIWGLRKLYKMILKEQGKPDIIHAHYVRVGYCASFLKEDTGIPLVITEHSSQMNRVDLAQRHRIIGSKAYNDADQLIAVSDALAHMIDLNFGIKAKSIPNLIDTDIFTYEGYERNDKYTIISAGNLVKTKRMDLIIEAFHRAFRDNPKVDLVIFGEGPERPKLEELISKYTLEKNITLCGLKSREEISKVFKEGDLFVLPSQTETFGVAYVEALASGIPVIATRCGGPEMFVTEENGVMIDVDDIDALTKAMIYMYNNMDKFDNEKIAKEAREKFSPSAIARKLIITYNDILNRNRGRIDEHVK